MQCFYQLAIWVLRFGCAGRQLCPISSPKDSNQIGLANIAAKYRLLSRTSPSLIRVGLIEPVIRDDDGYFTVVLPLFLP